MAKNANFFRQPCSFIAGAANIESLPPATLPEIAFIGRSNVGKSSLVNALVGQKALARTSQSPGHTRQLNFFNLADKLILVDMPGYGYAKVSKQMKSDWDLLIRQYLLGRTTLKRALVLIDARRGIMPHDQEFMEMLDETATVFNIVLTKADALKPKELAECEEKIQAAIKTHAAAHPQHIVTSSLKKTGIETLQDEIVPFALP